MVVNRFFFNKTATIKGLSYSGSPSKGTWSQLSTGNECYLEPLDEEKSAVNGLQWGEGFLVYFPDTVTVDASDRLTIDSVDYEVKGTQQFNMGGVNVIRCIVNKATR